MFSRQWYIIFFVLCYCEMFSQSSDFRLTGKVVFEQEIFRGNIADKNTRNPIEFVYVLDSLNRVVSVSDNSGDFEISKDLSNTKLTFSKYGYLKKTLTVDSIKDTIYLSPEILALEEVVLTQNKKSHITYYKYYFRTYDFKNSNRRRYIDGIVQYEYNKKKGRVKDQVLEYRSFGDKTLIEAERKGAVVVQHEGTGYLSFSLMSILEQNRAFQDYELVKTKNGFDILNKVGKVGQIITTPDFSKEISASILKENNLGKFKKVLGSSSRILLHASEEHYDPRDNYNTVSYLKTIKQTEFKRKVDSLFSTYESYSELFLLDTQNEPFQEKGVKLKRSESNYKSAFWINSIGISDSIQKSFHLGLEEF